MPEYINCRSWGLSTAVVVGSLLAPVSPASAQTTEAQIDALRAQMEEMQRTYQQQMNVLNQRIEELEGQVDQVEATVAPVTGTATAVRVEPGRDNVSLEIYGQINQGVLFADNGASSDFFIVDNDNSGSRLGIEGTVSLDTDFAGEITTGALLEVGFEVNTTDELSFGQDFVIGDEAGESDFLDVRHAEWYVETEVLGDLYVGFGDIATEDAAEVDLSGTTLVSESDVDDMAGGLEFEFDRDGMGPGPEVDTIFSNLDGSRESRIRYNTPTFYGVGAAVAVRQEDGGSPDVALTYAGDFGEYETEAAFGWRSESDDEANVFVGSASILTPFGVSFTAAGGVEQIDGAEDEMFLFGKVGYREDFFSFGESRFSVDYFYGEDNTEAIAGDSTEAQSFGFSAVQVVEPLSTEFYVGVRNYSVDYPGADDPDDLIAVLTGARVRF